MFGSRHLDLVYVVCWGRLQDLHPCNNVGPNMIVADQNAFRKPISHNLYMPDASLVPKQEDPQNYSNMVGIPPIPDKFVKYNII